MSGRLRQVLMYSYDEVITVSIHLHLPDTINYCRMVCDRNKKNRWNWFFLTERCVKVSFSIKNMTKCSDISHDGVITVSINSHCPDKTNYSRMVCDWNKRRCWNWKKNKNILTVRCVKVSFSIKIVTKCSDISHEIFITVSSTFFLTEKRFCLHASSPSCWLIGSSENIMTVLSNSIKTDMTKFLRTKWY